MTPPLTYCLNVQPGEAFADQWDAARAYVAALRTTVPGTIPLGLRIARQAASEAQHGGLAEAFHQWTLHHNAPVITINGFPYGNFHRVPVKASVYRPDWTDPMRRDYTMELATLLAGWLPTGQTGSISTVPGWYAPDIIATDRPAALALAITHLLETARHLDALAEHTGKNILIGLEPEPWCLLEETADVVAFFHHALTMLPDADARIFRRRIGVCLDTCHAALAFESPGNVLATLRQEGIRVAKIQISAALEWSPHPGWTGALAPFAEPMYLHQTAAMLYGQRRRWPDLNEAIGELENNGDWSRARAHYHVPLHWTGAGPLRTTAHVIDDDFWQEAADSAPHLEIETYTHHILSATIAPPTWTACAIAEYRWCEQKRAAIRQ